jgi:phytoene dehydrogenase-like protein
MPRRLQAILAGQAGDYLLPPEQVSFLLHVALCAGYDRGAYYPERHFSHLVETLVGAIRERAGCDLLLEHEVARIRIEDGRAVGVETTSGQFFRANRIISNVDPAVTLQLAGIHGSKGGRKRGVGYEYSSSNFTLYLGVEGIDLRDYGFGSFNVWHYPHDDLNRIYRAQTVDNDLTDPWLFMSTPTLHTGHPGLAPAGHQLLLVATSANYDHYRRLMAEGRRAYTREKVKVRDQILTVIERNYIPNLRRHLAIKVAGTPLTNERFVRAPRGNAYGAALTPAHVRWPRFSSSTPVANLKVVNATAGYPSVAGTVGAGLRIFDELTRA